MALGVDWEAFMADKAPAVNKFNLLQWLQYQDYLNNKGDRGIGEFKARQEEYFTEHPKYREIYIDAYRREEQNEIQ